MYELIGQEVKAIKEIRYTLALKEPIQINGKTVKKRSFKSNTERMSFCQKNGITSENIAVCAETLKPFVLSENRIALRAVILDFVYRYIRSRAVDRAYSNKLPYSEIYSRCNVDVNSREATKRARADIAVILNHLVNCDSLQELKMWSEYTNKHSKKADGIQIDDYFYPSTDESIDRIQFEKYRSGGGSLSLSEWRIATVNAFVAAFYSAVKSFKEDLIISISPSANIKTNETELYADCRLWLSAEGYADLIIPQIYFGFNHESLPFSETLSEWGNFERSSSVKLACGIAAYKCNENCSYYNENEKYDWQSRKNNLAMQVSMIKENRNYCGFAVFSYSDLTDDSCKEEIDNLKQLLITENKNEERQNTHSLDYNNIRINNRYCCSYVCNGFFTRS